jgi:glutathione reductase (NADPH)
LALTTYDISDMPEIPRKSLVIGGGIIAIEVASLMNKFGSDVTLVSEYQIFNSSRM